MTTTPTATARATPSAAGDPAGGRATGTARYRLLFIHPGPVPPSADPRKNLLFHLSACGEGDLLSTRWSDPEDGTDRPDPGRFATLGRFGYRATRSMGLPPLVRSLWHLAYFVGEGLRLSRRAGGYDAVVTYGPFTTAVGGWVLKKLTGARLIIDVPGHPIKPFTLQQGPLGRVKERVARALVPAMLRRADAVKTLYPGQLDDVPGCAIEPAGTFPDFVPIPTIEPSGDDGRYVLFLGFPWHLKGVDLLIQAFLRIADRHPDVRLKVVGHCPDRTPFERLAGGHPRVEFERGVGHAEAMRLMAGCTAFALASRTEGVPRVLLEAMAAGKPFVASRVGGIPAYFDEGRGGLLFEPEDIRGLADGLDRLLGDPEEARRLGERGRRIAKEEMSEACYVDRFREMLDAVLGPRRIPGRQGEEGRER